ncbi:hypothetical protein AB0I22_01305 [Streptomyces sp. NPDC050610]|uniref:hypothetical protein n=1 Tax=Streptomyces sp. NPDC050610 TaxID=3157097 RepID=UPI00341F4D11
MITTADPWQGHDFAVLLPILMAGSGALLSLVVYLCSRLARQDRRRFLPFALWRDASLSAVAAALALYLWGCLHLLFPEGRELAEECERRRPEGVPSLVGRRGDFIPLRLVCEASNGQDYSVVIPEYVNPFSAALLLIALACAVVAVALHHRQRPAVR